MSQSELEKWNNKRKRKNNIRFAIGFLLLALFVSVLVDGIRDGFANMSENGQYIFLIGFGMLMLWIFIDQGFFQRNRCTATVTAECIDIVNSRAGYCPRFRYQWEGETYSETVLLYASKRKTMKQYVEGYEYAILINPDNPREIRVDRKIGWANIFMIVMGIIMIALPMYKLFFEN